MSDKRRRIQVQRRSFVAEQLALRPHCEAGERIHAATNGWAGHATQRPSTELHEPKTRARYPGADTILDPENSVAICRQCHDWTHTHPAWAAQVGLLVPSR